MSQTGPAVIDAIINKVDELFCLAAPSSEKDEFSNDYKKLRRKIVQEMRIFKEHLDRESNKAVSSKLAACRKQQETKGINAMSALQVLVRIYYLKQMQAQEDLIYNARNMDS